MLLPLLLAFSPFLKPILFHFIEQVCLAAAQIHNLWTAISVLFLHSALLTVVGVTDARTPTDDAPGKEDELHLFNVQRRFQPALIRAVVALVANPDESTRPNIGVTDDALPITLLAQTPWFSF